MNTTNLAETTILTETQKPRAASGWHLPGTFGLDLLRLGVLATLCTGAALVLNQLREPPLPLVYASKRTRLEEEVKRTARVEIAALVQAVAPTASEPAAVRVVGLAEFQRLVASRQAVVLDARPEIFYRLGHVPGARSLSREEFERDYGVQRVFLESRRGQPIAVYCSSASCEDSQMVADALVKLGYRQVLVFKGGWDEWINVGGEKEN